MISLTILDVKPDADTIVVSVQRSDTKEIEEHSFSSSSTVQEIKEAIADKCNRLNKTTDLSSLIGTIIVPKE